jgi:hypothetical protein
MIGRLTEGDQRIVHRVLLLRRTVDHFQRSDQTGRGEVLQLLPLVRAGVRFVDGRQEKPKSAAGEVEESAA